MTKTLWFYLKNILINPVFFFGVWGGVETGRYLESCMNKKHE